MSRPNSSCWAPAELTMGGRCDRSPGEGGARCCIAVICSYAHSVQEAREKPELLLPTHFNSADVRVRTIDGLILDKSYIRRSGAGGCHRVNRIRQVFVKPSNLNQAYRLQVVLQQKIKILSMGWLQVRVTRGNRWIRGGIIDHIRDQVEEVRDGRCPCRRSRGGPYPSSI